VAKEVAETKRPYEVALQEIDGRAALDEGDSFGIAAEVADKIMSAETLEGVIEAAEQGPEDLEFFTGTSFQFIGGSLRWSHAAEQFREGGTGYYAVFKVVDMKGTEHLVSTGATNVVFQLRKMEKLGVFDEIDVAYPTYFTVKSRPTGKGTLYRISFA